MNKVKASSLLLAMALVAVMAAGCAKKPAPVEPAAPVVSQPAPVAPVMQETVVTEAPVQPMAPTAMRRIFFDFDQYVLTAEAKAILADNAAYLKANGGVQVRIEGHCDERGSDEYNLALGERRARAAMNYLLSLGVAAKRLDVISYGEERPLDPARNDMAWSKNRRAEFVVR